MRREGGKGGRGDGGGHLSELFDCMHGCLYLSRDTCRPGSCLSAGRLEDKTYLMRLGPQVSTLLQGAVCTPRIHNERACVEGS